MRRNFPASFFTFVCFAGLSPSLLAKELFYVTNDNRVSAVTDGVVTPLAPGRGLPTGMAMDKSGNLFVGDAGDHTVWRLTPSGQISTFATLPQENPTGIAIDPSGNVYVATIAHNRIYKITPSGQSSVISAGNPEIPYDLAFDKAGNLFIASFAANRFSGFVTELKPSGQTSIVASGLDHPSGLTVDSAGNIYVADFADNGDAGNVMKIDPAGNKTLVANVNSPSDVAVGADGSIYVTSHFTSTLSHISPNGDVIPITQDLEAARNIISVPEPCPAVIIILLATSGFRRKRT